MYSARTRTLRPMLNFVIPLLVLKKEKAPLKDFPNTICNEGAEVKGVSAFLFFTLLEDKLHCI